MTKSNVGYEFDFRCSFFIFLMIFMLFDAVFEEVDSIVMSDLKVATELYIWYPHVDLENIGTVDRLVIFKSHICHPFIFLDVLLSWIVKRSPTQASVLRSFAIVS